MIYPQLLKADFANLPAALRDFHSTRGTRHAAGKVAVRHDSALARLVGFPPPGDDIPVRLDVIVEETREVWTRRFGDNVRRSTQWTRGDLLIESFGPARVAFRVASCANGMRFESVAVRVLGVPFPLHIEATERGGDSSWEFEVQIQRIGSYHGVMEPIT